MILARIWSTGALILMRTSQYAFFPVENSFPCMEVRLVAYDLLWYQKLFLQINRVGG